MENDQNSIAWRFGNIICICIYKRKLLVICFSPNIIQRTKSSPQSQLALINIAPEVILIVLFKSNDCWAVNCDRLQQRSYYYLVAMATIQIMHFDQLGTICNDYPEVYRITGA